MTAAADRRTDRITITKTVQRIASHGKNRQFVPIAVSFNILSFEFRDKHNPFLQNTTVFALSSPPVK